MTRYKYVNGEKLPYTAEEEAARDAAEAAAEADIAANGYKRVRQEKYPTIAEQLDMQYWDKKNGTTTWVDAINKIKNDNPKP